MSHETKEPFQHFTKYVQEFIVGFKYLDEFLSKREIFNQNLGLKYLVLEKHLNEMVSYILQLYTQIPAPLFDEVLRREFIGVSAEHAAFIFNVMNVRHLQSLQIQQQFNEFATQAQQRIAELEAEVNRLKT